MKKVRLKSIVLALVLVGLIGGTVALTTHRFALWTEGSYAGKISEVQDSSFTIVEKGGQHKIVALSEHTLIKKGKETTSRGALQTGTLVIVFGSLSEKDIVAADIIRVLDAGGMRSTQ